MSTEPLPPNYYDRPEPPRRRTNRKHVVAIATLAVIVLLIGLFVTMIALLHNEAFRQRLIAVARAKVSAALGADVQARDFALHLSGLNPSVDMYDVSIAGSAPHADTPLLRADHLAVAIRIDSFVRREWYLSNIALDHPVVHIVVDPAGGTNLPKASSNSQTDVFDLGVHHVAVNSGEFYYNDHQSAISADLRDVQLQSQFDKVNRKYFGTVHYSDGNLHVENLNPVVHGLSAKFDATPVQFKLDDGRLTTGGSQIEFAATLDDYAQPRVQAQYQATVDAGDVRNILKDNSLPTGVIQLSGAFHYENAANRPLIQALTFEGNAVSKSIVVRTPGRPPITINDLAGRYKLENGNLNLGDLRARALGGSLNGELAMRDVTGAAASKIHAVLHDVQLIQLQALMMNSPMPRDVMLSGAANANIDASWSHSLNNLVARTDAQVRGSIHAIRKDGPQPIPLVGDIHASYDGRSDQIAFSQSSLQMPHTSVTLNGTVSRTSALDVQMQTTDLAEVETVANVFHPIEPLGLTGSASFVGSIMGTTAVPQIAGHLRADSFKVRGTDWRMLDTDVTASPSQVSLVNGQITPAVRGQLSFNVMAGLSDWAFTDTSPIDVRASGSQLNAVDLVHLSGQEVPVAGTVAANVRLQGSTSSPQGQGTVTLTNGAIYDEPVNSANLNFQGTGEELRGNLDVRLPAGAARGNFTVFPKQQGYDAQIDATGVRLEQLHAVKSRNVQLTGVLDLKASGRGTLDNPGGQVSLSVPQLKVQDQTISGFTLQADVKDHMANVSLDSQSRDIYIKGKGNVELRGEYNVDAVFDTSSISLQPLVAAYVPSQANNISGKTEIHAKIAGPLKDQSRLDAHLTIPVFDVHYRNMIDLAAANPIQMDYTKGVLTIQPASIRGTGTDIQIQGKIPTTGTEPAAVRAVGTVDLRLAELFNPDITSSGQLRLNVNGVGASGNPNVQGQIEIVNASFAAADAPLGMQNGNGMLRLTNTGLEIDRFQANVGDGVLTAKGGLAYRPAVQFNLSANTSGIRLSYPHGVRETVDANLTLTGTPQKGAVQGQVHLQQISFASDFDFADLVGELAANTVSPQGMANNIDLDISVRSSDSTSLVTSKLNLDANANLQVRGTAGKPVVIGRMNVESGNLIFRGNRYTLQPSSVEFVNPYETEPNVNLEVETRVQAYDVRMRMRGTMDHLQTTYTSDPALPPADIINLLVFGKTNEAADANPQPFNLGAESFVASQASSQITSRVEKVAGLSQLSVDPILGGNQKNPGARVTIQQQVTGNLFVAFSSDPTSTERQVVKLEYQVSPKMSVSGVRDQNGGFALDVRMKKSW